MRSTSYTPVTILPLFFANNLEGDTYGAELNGVYQISEAWSLHAGYTLLMEHLRGQAGRLPGSSEQCAERDFRPEKHQFSLRSSVTLPMQVSWDAGLRWIDTLHNNSGAVAGTVPALFL